MEREREMEEWNTVGTVNGDLWGMVTYQQV